MPATVIERLATARIVPVIVLEDAGMAQDVAAALAAGGIRAGEITLRTDAGLEAIRAIAGNPDFVVGAGTVLTPEDVDRCVDAGAEFIVSPGFDDDVVARAHERGVVALPGVATATEIQRAMRAGLQEMKFFPADKLGGLATIAALAGPFRHVRFLPSGGVNPTNAAEYLGHPSVFAIGGSWMVAADVLAARDFDRITRLSAEAVSLLSAT
jgi:2-dehydro-3-deoxyphosphogluconate aldolase/(4S)-4-hydroxy-2-oxoglutarate aldolase